MSWELEAQRAAEEHLAACQEALWSEELEEEMAESPAVAPFDGCDTCIVREVLSAAWPIFLKAAREEAQASLYLCG